MATRPDRMGVMRPAEYRPRQAMPTANEAQPGDGESSAQRPHAEDPESQTTGAAGPGKPEARLTCFSISRA